MKRRDFLFVTFSAATLTACGGSDDGPVTQAPSAAPPPAGNPPPTGSPPPPPPTATPPSSTPPPAGDSPPPAPAPAPPPPTDAPSPAPAPAPPPPAAALPSWTPAPGELVIVPTTNTFMSLREGQVPGFEFLFNKIVDSFSGGVYNPYWGTYGAMMLSGGGHASTYDNSLLMLDYNDLTFKRLSNASPPTTYTDSYDDPLLNLITGEYADGQPASGHTFDMLSILPPADGGAEAGSLFRVSGQGIHVKMSRSTNWAHRFDIRRDMIEPSKRGKWVGATDSAPTDYRSPGACSAYDPTRKRIWWISALYSQPPLIRYLDIGARRQETVRFTSLARVAPHGDSDSITLRYHAALDIVILSCTAFDVFTMAYLHCSRPQDGWFRPTLSAPIPSLGGRSYPFDYVPEIDRYVMLAPADPTAVYEIQVPATPTDLWDVTRRPFKGLSTIPWQRVAGKRWSYAPAVKAFVWLARAQELVYAYRPHGT